MRSIFDYPYVRNIAFHLGSIFILFGEQTFYYPPLLVLEPFGAGSYIFARHGVHVVTLDCEGSLTRLGGHRPALSCAGMKRVWLSVHWDSRSWPALLVAL